MAILAELAKRAFAHPTTSAFVKRAVAGGHDGGKHDGGSQAIPLPIFGMILVYVTLFASGLLITFASYCLQEVVTTLCMVESPVAAITISPSTHESGDKDEKEGLLETGPTITLVNQKPITSSIRATIKHLVAHAGRFSRFRGFKLYILYAILTSMVATFFEGALPNVPGREIFAAGASAAAVANIHATWTHKVVSMPTNKSLWQRVPSKAHWKTLALPAAIQATMPYISIYLVGGFGIVLGMHKLQNDDFREYNCAQWTSLILRGIALVVFAIVCTLFLCLPAIVTLVRIEASILPEEEDTIVPFDRTFGGKVVSKALGGTGVVGFLTAWRSFNWEARRRLIKLYMKSFLLITTIVFVVFHVVLLELILFAGPQIAPALAFMANVNPLA